MLLSQIDQHNLTTLKKQAQLFKFLKNNLTPYKLYAYLFVIHVMQFWRVCDITENFGIQFGDSWVISIN